MPEAHHIFSSFDYFTQGAGLSDTDFDTDKAVFFIGDDVTISLLREALLTSHCPESGQHPSYLARELGNKDN